MQALLIFLGAAAFGAAGFLLSHFLVKGLNVIDEAIIRHGVNPRAGLILNIAAAVMSAFTFFMCDNVLGGILGCLFWVSLSSAAYSDGLTCEVYDWVYYPGILGVVLLLFVLKPGLGILPEMCIFLALQLFLFRFMYGGSDCIAFSLCALFLAAFGCGLLEYMLVMLLTLVLFTPWQAFRGNIHVSAKSFKERRFLKLKEPKAMIPFIFSAMSVMTVAVGVMGFVR